MARLAKPDCTKTNPRVRASNANAVRFWRAAGLDMAPRISTSPGI
jgi:hypothetical protein